MDNEELARLFDRSGGLYARNDGGWRMSVSHDTEAVVREIAEHVGVGGVGHVEAQMRYGATWMWRTSNRRHIHAVCTRIRPHLTEPTGAERVDQFLAWYADGCPQNVAEEVRVKTRARVRAYRDRQKRQKAQRDGPL